MSIWRNNTDFGSQGAKPNSLGTDLRAAMASRLAAEEMAKPYPTVNELVALPDQRTPNYDGFVGGAGAALSFVSKRLGIASITGLLMSSQGTSLKSYNERFNVNDESRLLVQKGYALLLTAPMVEQLNSILLTGFARRGGSYPFVQSKPIMTGNEIMLLVSNVDGVLSPDGPLHNWLTKLVKREFIKDSDGSKLFNAKSTLPKGQGGMRGGYNNAYHGITQFSAPTYDWVGGFGRSVGVNMPSTREELSFAGQLVAAYLLGVLNQGLIRPFIQGPITADQLYIAHNQGAGVFKTRKLTSKRFLAQSADVKALLRKERFDIQ